MDAIRTVLDRWRAEGVVLNPPADATEIVRLETALGMPLPADVRRYLSIADGMEESESTGDSLASFWSVRRMLSDPWRPSGEDALGEFHDLAFADAMIGSWFLCFRRRRAPGLTIHVEGALVELPSLEAFFERYLRDPESLCL